ncbi:hypothetical protein PAT3040_06108 [Paenibacillus agaridevorans]|uniref:Uncharacterized protein n=1 Tax=Paenibacillus agaridevorans TaxID=171404 RepID=A0A2R5EXN1_9BACL|nr:hypothetical protein PAT3040_06108 [Paenibacillus agaridevorans]
MGKEHERTPDGWRTSVEGTRNGWGTIVEVTRRKSNGHGCILDAVIVSATILTDTVDAKPGERGDIPCI